jgi:hypothetical protein
MATDFMDFLNFEDKENSVLNDVSPDFRPQSGTIIKMAVSDILPTTVELNAIGNYDVINEDPRTLVAWNEGISLELIQVAYINQEGNELPLWTVENGKVKFNYNAPHYYMHFESLRVSEIERGYLRIYNDNHEAAKISALPMDWDARTSIQKFAWWRENISRKFGSPKLNPGDAFYSVFVLDKGKAGGQWEGKYFNRHKKVAQVEGKGIIEAPWELGTIPIHDIRLVREALLEERARRDSDGVSFNPSKM